MDGQNQSVGAGQNGSGRSDHWGPFPRNMVLAAAVALLAGLWGGAAMSRLAIGGGPSGVLGLVAGPEAMRNANAPRAGGVAGLGAMAFMRFRTDTGGDAPVACLEFSQDVSLEPNVNYADFVKIEPAAQVAFEPVGQSLCLRGLPFEPDREITILTGLPAKSGDRTTAEEKFKFSFGDRNTMVGFAGQGVILPRAEADGLGVETVNVSKLSIEVLRVSDRILSRETIEEGQAVPEGSWDYWSIEEAGGQFGVSIFKGEIDVAKTDPATKRDNRNRTVTTVFPLGSVLKEGRPGAYVVRIVDASPSAGSGGKENDRPAAAVRWIVYTDIALQTFDGATGLDVVARSLQSARPMGGITLTLVADNNDELARATTNAQGQARFIKAAMSGEGPLRPRYVMAYGAGGDFAALDLDRATLDLSDRDVDGRNAPGDIDAFMFTDRGIYRPGELVRVNGMIRDGAGRAIMDRMSTLVITRPNGTEAMRLRLAQASDAGAIVKSYQIGASAPRGVWTARLEVDGQKAPAGDVSFSVEDFVPQRLRVGVTAQEAPLGPGQSRAIAVDAQYLYGAPGAGLVVEGEARLQLDPNPFKDPALKGFSFGKPEETFEEKFIKLNSSVTDGAGKADLNFTLTDPPTTTLPLRAVVVASVAEPGGRVVRESFRIPVRTRDIYLGVRPKFDSGRVNEGGRADFELAALNAAGARAATRVSWRLVEEDWNYDWYLDGGRWKWRRSGRDIPVAGAQGVADIPANGFGAVGQEKLRPGSYRLIVKHEGSGMEAEYRFGVGWGGPAGDADTPDMVSVVPPATPAAADSTVRIQIKPPYAGEAQIVVATDRVLSMRTVSVPAEGRVVDLRVEREWGAGAYVLVTVVTPRDAAGRNAIPVVPRRAVGVGYVMLDTKPRTYTVEIGKGLGVVRPRTRINVPVEISGGPRERVRLVMALVDEGVLSLTKFQSPNPAAHYFARRALGVGVRDDYGRLLNPNLAAATKPRSGGDSLGGEGLSVVPTKTIALWSGIVQVQNGRAVIPLDVPDFNGELRLMAVAYSETGVGSGAAPLTIRDPVVADLALPRFLAPGDAAFGTLTVNNIDGPAGNYAVTLAGQGAAGVNAPPVRATLNQGGSIIARVPIQGGAAALGRIDLTLTGPQGFTQITRSYDIQSRTPWLPITDVQVAQIGAGQSFTLNSAALAPFRPGEGAVSVSFSQLRGLDPAPLLKSLERYPYGCTEQLVSVAMPLLYANTLASAAGQKADPRLNPRLNEVITKVLDRQDADGAFGLWRAGDVSASPWLGAYVMDFLVRARAAGLVVPQEALNVGFKGLRAVARLDDFGNAAYAFEVWPYPGNTDSKELLRSRASAYALYVLAKAGQADLGQLRYFHDAKLRAEPSPLARAHIGAGLAFLGDRARARSAFRAAEEGVNRGYRNTGDYYQTPLRDLAGVVALVAEAAGGPNPDPELSAMLDRLTRKLEQDAPPATAMMTQEQAQMLLAANGLIARAQGLKVSLNGQAGGPAWGYEALAALLNSGATFRNDGTGPLWRTVTSVGPTLAPPPAASQGLAIEKRFFTLSGAPVDVNAIRQGDRIVVALSGAPQGQRLVPAVMIDLLPAGFEIDSVMTPADGRGQPQWDGRQNNGPFAWLGEITRANVTEGRDDRFVAAVDLRGSGFTLAYVVRAVTPGTFTLPGAQIEDMYKPGVFGRSAPGQVRISAR
jgi:alpha-2-macroglobulin